MVSSTAATATYLEIRGLTVEFPSATVPARVVRDVSLSVGRGEVVGLVGESGCGKTTLARAITRLLPSSARVVGGEVRLGGRDLLGLPDDEMRRMRSTDVSVVFQHAQSALDPLM